MEGKTKRKSLDPELQKTIIDIKIIQKYAIYPFLYHMYILEA